MHTDRYQFRIPGVATSIDTRQLALILGLAILPIVVQAAPDQNSYQSSYQNTYQTYVIHTYGGEALLPAVRQKLNSSRDGGTVATYQDKLVLNTTAANYQAVQQLLTRIDRQPQALTVSVRVGNNSSAQSNTNQGRVIITNQGIQGSGIINQRHSQQQNNSLYQVQTLSGSAASISTGTLWSLTQTYNANVYSSYKRPSGQIIIQQQVLLPTTQGIQVKPRLLPNGQVEVNLAQVEEKLVSANSSYSQNSSNRNAYSNNTYSNNPYPNNSYPNNAIKRQSLNSTIIVPRGQWVNIGQISQSTQNQRANYGGNSTRSSNNSAPIWLLVQ